MRVLLLSRHSRKGASSRMRCLQYLPMLAEWDIDVDVKPLYDESYLTDLYQFNRRRLKRILYRYLERISPLLTSRRYNLLWIQQELFPWIPPVAEWLLNHFNMPFIVDCDDAIFHKYDLHKNKMVRRLLGRKVDLIMKYASVVIAGNSYIASRAINAGAKAVRIVPTVIDLNRYPAARLKKNALLTIGWIGSPATYEYFKAVAPILIDLQKRLPVRVVVVGAANPGQNDRLPFTFYPWSEDTEVESVKSFDLGIMPLPNTPWAKGKCGYKLIQYMACGLPVVASKVGANIDIVEPGKNGFLVSTPQEWAGAIERIVTDDKLRKRMGEHGRRRVEQFYN
uniref:glycosyltransferase family 4 protein n=1 Tax=Desulfosarcina sp. TaxID=2027861 RepID=UPI00356A49D7